MSKIRKINVSEFDGSQYSIFPAGTLWVDLQNRLRVSDGITEGGISLAVDPTVIYPTAGAGTAGIIFPDDPGGGSGDTATIKWYPITGEQMRLHIDVQNDNDDEILIEANGPIKIKSGLDLWSFADNTITFPDTTMVSGGFINGGNTSHTAGIATFSSWNQVYAQDSSVGIQTSADGNVYNTWSFDNDGIFNIPSGLQVRQIQAPVDGTQMFQNADEWLTMASQGTNGVTQLGWALNPLNTGDVAIITFNNNAEAGIEVTTGVAGGESYTWAFDNTGILTLSNNSELRPNGAGIDLRAAATGYAQLQNSTADQIVGVNDTGAYITANATASIVTWSFGTDGVLGLPNDAYLSQDGSDNIFASQGEIVIRANATVNETTKNWGFNTVGQVTWPGGGVLGVRIPPVHSTGIDGDLAGDIAFDTSYFYYCTANYGGTVYNIDSITSSLVAHSYLIMYDFSSGFTSNDLTGYTVSGPGGYSGTVSGPSQDQGAGQWYIPVTPILTQEMGTYTFTSAVDIWKRIQWSGDTW